MFFPGLIYLVGEWLQFEISRMCAEWSYYACFKYLCVESEIVLGRFLTRNFVAKLEIIQAIKEADEEDDDSDDGEDYENADDNIVDISLEEELQPVLQRTRTRNRPKREA